MNIYGDTIIIPEELDGYVVTAIDRNALWDSNYLASVTIPDCVTTIEGNPFRSSQKATDIIVSPEHPALEVIDGVLVDKTEMRIICYPRANRNSSYAIPQGVRIIGDSAFYDCSSLTDVVIPDSVTHIESNAFNGCSSLTSVTFPNSVTHVGESLFTSCTELKNIIVSPENPVLATIDGVLFDKTEKKLIFYPCKNTNRSYAIPQGIRAIGSNAFAYCEHLSVVTIPDSVTTIGECAFYYCSWLMTVKMPDSLVFIGEGAFSHCTSLASVVIPDSVTTIGAYAFKSCKALRSVTIPDAVTAIGNYAFCDCFMLNSVELSDSLTDIGDSAFKKCSRLTSVTLPASLTSIGKDAFANCDGLTFTVSRSTFAAQWCADNGCSYAYPDSDDWLLN